MVDERNPANAFHGNDDSTGYLDIISELCYNRPPRLSWQGTVTLSQHGLAINVRQQQ
jgi:hypothetical protein